MLDLSVGVVHISIFEPPSTRNEASSSWLVDSSTVHAVVSQPPLLRWLYSSLTMAIRCSILTANNQKAAASSASKAISRDCLFKVQYKRSTIYPPGSMMYRCTRFWPKLNQMFSFPWFPFWVGSIEGGSSLDSLFPKLSALDQRFSCWASTCCYLSLSYDFNIACFGLVGNIWSFPA